MKGDRGNFQQGSGRAVVTQSQATPALGVAQLSQVTELRRVVTGHPGLLCSQSSQPPVAGLGTCAPVLHTAAVSNHHYSSHHLVLE